MSYVYRYIKEFFFDHATMISLLLFALPTITTVILVKLIHKKFFRQIICIIGVCISVLSSLLFFIMVYYWCNTDIDVKESPEGDYRIIVRWVDQGGAGYASTNVVIEEAKPLGKRVKTDLRTPISIEWISDHEFTADGSSGVKEIHSVYEWFDE
jgi:hypothetical protein